MNKVISFLRSGMARLGSLGRKREEDADEPAPSQLAETVVDVQAVADAPVEDADVRPSVWSRLLARFGKREAAETDEAAVEAPAADARQEEHEQEPAKGLWSRLMAKFSLRKKAAGDEGEGEAPLPDAKGDRADGRAGGDKRAGGRAGSRAEVLEAEAPGEQSERGRVRGMLARKPVWISLVVLAVAGVSAAGWFAANAFRTRSDASTKILQQRNQALAEQNRKLQAENVKLAQARNKPRAPTPSRAAATDPTGEPVAGNAAEDCTVKDKASVRDTLKGCIEGFNAGSGR